MPLSRVVSFLALAAVLVVPRAALGQCPAAPQSVDSATVQFSLQLETVTVTWAPPSGGCPPQEFQVSFTTSGNVASSPASVTATTVTFPLTDSAPRYFAVRGRNVHGEGPWSSFRTFTRPAGCVTPPGPPTALAGTVANYSTATFTWTAPTGACAATRYTVELINLTFWHYSSVSVTAPTYETSLWSGEWHVRVKAVNPFGDSAWSASVPVIIPGTTVPCWAPPGPPRAVTTSARAGVLTIDWTHDGACSLSGWYLTASLTPDGPEVGAVVLPYPNSRTFSAQVPSGAYWIRVGPLSVAGRGQPAVPVFVFVP